MGSVSRLVGMLAPVLLVSGLAGCVPGALRRERTALEDGLKRADELFAGRADRASLDEAVALLDALALDADDPQILARQARCDYALAYGYPGEDPPPSALYLEGRERAWRCLIREPAFSGMLTTTGGRVTPAVVARIGTEQGACLSWLVANWARWLALEDPAANGIDLEPLGLFVGRSVALSEGTERSAALGLSALVASLTPIPLAPDLEAAAGRFEEAIALNPGDLSLRVDLAERVLLPLGAHLRFRETLQAVEASTLQDDEPRALENRRARERARILLEADTTPPSSQR